MDPRCAAGGILEVLKLAEDYKPAFVYDLRSRFGLGLSDLGTTVPWDEVISLVAVLLRDPSSWLQTAKNGWSHPIDYNWTIQAATYDLLAQVHSKRKPKPWPRPFKDAENRRVGQNVNPNARAILRRAKDGEIEWQSKPTPM